MRVLQISFLTVGVYLHKISSELLTMTLRLGDIAQALFAAVLRVLQIPSFAVAVYFQKISSELLTMTLRL